MTKQRSIKMSPKLKDNLKTKGIFNSVMSYIWDSKFIQAIVEWNLDWRYGDTKTKLVEWAKTNTNTVPAAVVKDLSDLKNLTKNDSLARQCLMYVKRKTTYTKDMDVWKVSEKWQTPQETWTKGTGDCEDGAILLYAIMKFVGFKDDQMWLVAGDVEGGGHCYLVYRGDDSAEYVLDWCYWADKSIKMDTIYEDRPEYFYGEKEWFRFNASGGFKTL